ncbi:MAG TPA: TVP38/TMEM64 family protein [Aestuariivirga sp.]
MLSETAQHTIRRLLPLVGLLALTGCCYALGFQYYLGIESLAENQATLQDFVTQHVALAIALYFLLYVAVVSLSLPGAGLLSIVGGFIFGWALSVPVTIVAATIGAVIVFKIVQSSLGATMAQRAGPFLQKLERGFETNAFSYLLFLRLVPAFPFFAVNAVAGLTRMKLRTFALATLVGIIPGTFAFAIVGRGLGSVLDGARAVHAACLAQDASAACPYAFSASDLVTQQLLWGFAALGVVSLIPVVMKKWKMR